MGDQMTLSQPCKNMSTPTFSHIFHFNFSAYIKRQYLKKNKSPTRDLYDFATTATDTDLVKNIFGVIQDIILSRMLESQGFE